MKPTKCNDINSRIEESSAKNNTEQEICNEKKSNKLEETQFDNNTEVNFAQINIHANDKENSTEHKEVNFYENE